MNAVLQKMKADITSRPLLSLLIIITIAAASMLLTLALATLLNLSAPYDQSFTELNAAHLWLHFDRAKTRPRDISRIESLPRVTASTGLQYSLRSRVKLGDKRVWVSLRAMSTEPPTVNRLLVQQGRNLSPHQAEILAAKDLNDLYKLQVGDEITLTRADGKEVSLPVIGLAYNPMWDTYRTSQPPYLYITEETLRELSPNEADWDWSLGLRLADPQAVGETVTQIKTLLRPDAVADYTDWRNVRESAMFEAQLNFVLLGAFGVFAILAAMLVVMGSVSAAVLSQFRQIGLLKAIGFTQSQILWLYLGQYLALSLIGTIGGLLLGVLLSPLPLQSVAASLSVTFRPPFNFVLIALVLGMISAVVVLATLGAAYRGAQANIIKAIATGAEAPRHKPFWGIQLAWKLGLPPVFILGLNDVTVRPFRSIITGVNLLLGVVGIVFGLTLNETVNAYRTDPALLGIVYDAVVTRDETSDSEAQHLLQSAPGVAAFYGQYVTEVKTLNGESFRLKAVEGDMAAFPFNIQQGRFFEPNTNEAIAGRGLLGWLNLRVGDELTLLLNNRPVSWHIVGQYAEPANAGQMLIVSLPTAARFIKEAKADTYYLKLGPNFNFGRLQRYLAPRPEADLNLVLVEQAIPGSVIYLQLAIFVLAAILIGIALVNVFNTSLLSVQEKLRAIGVFKTVGMTPTQVIMMVNTSAGFLGLLATCLGIPLGLIFTQGLLTALAEGYGFGTVQVNLNGVYIVSLIPLMVAVSMLGSFIPARQAARVVITQVLRHE